MRFLVVEDDPKIRKFIARGLEAESHQVDVAADGREALSLAVTGRYDLVVLDMMLPGLDGLDVLRGVREVNTTLPIIAVTARGAVEDRVHGLDCGADDYLVKPFSFVELLARIRALLRRTDTGSTVELQVRGLMLDRFERRATYAGESVALSAREFQLLEYLMRTADEPQTRAMIADRVWGYQFDTGTNVVDVYVNYVRKKLRELGLEPIRTLRGIGYRLDAAACGVVEP